MLNLMKGLNGYTFCSGIICGELNGSEYTAVPIKNATDKMEIGYITRKDMIISDIARTYIEKIESFLK